MSYRNEGSNEQEILQNIFTAYVVKAIHRERQAYLKKKYSRQNYEAYITECHMSFFYEDDFAQGVIDRELLLLALKMLGEKERYILIAHVLEGKDFETIAKELCMKYKGVASIYYRTSTKLRRVLEAYEDGF